MHLPASKDGTSLDTRKADATTPASPSTPREKPQKVLPCPRCESMNTKFCYYNNYSVNQPRHFCRQCQRYWTVGGTLRNVPVGGGSRKKNRHQCTSEPYPRTCSSTTTGGGPHALATPSFQNMPVFNFAQLPGLNTNPFGAAYPTMQPDHQTMVPGMYINPLTTNSGEFQPMYAQPGAPSFYANLAQLQPKTHVKPEFWTGNHQVWEQIPKQADHDQVKTNESSMMLHLGLNSSRPHHGKPATWNKNNQVTGTSPPHGSSTIEEEGSTPTNGYSNSGYEEGDTVSSMWGEMQEIQDIFQ